MSTRKNPGFDYFALHYLRLWEGREEGLHNDLSNENPTPDALTRAMHGFRIARSFKGIGDPERRMRVIEHIKDVGNDGANSVTKLTCLFGDEFGRENLSAASKLLWLRHRSPFLIYDRNAVVALTMMSPKAKIDRNYGEFEAVWRSEFGKREKEVVAAAHRLTGLLPYFDHVYDERALHSLGSSQWFHERVFDVYLWHLGGKVLAEKKLGVASRKAGKAARLRSQSSR